MRSIKLIFPLLLFFLYGSLTPAYASGDEPEFISNTVGMMKLLGKGALLTLYLSVITGVVALVTGAMVGVGTSSRNSIIRGACNFFIWLIRGTPLLVQLFIAYFGFATLVNRIAGTEIIDAFFAALIALIINTTAYNAETIRGGINSVELGQWDAAASLGMTRVKIMRRVILPQAFTNSLPSLGNNLVVLIKDTSLVGAISLIELTYSARNIMNQTAQPFTPFLLAAVYYLVMISFVTVGVKYLETYLHRSKRKVAETV